MSYVDPIIWVMLIIFTGVWVFGSLLPQDFKLLGGKLSTPLAITLLVWKIPHVF